MLLGENVSCRTEEIDLYLRIFQLLASLRLFSFRDNFAKLAGMLAVKCLRESFFQRRVLGVIDDHARPSDRLKQSPMPADGANQRSGNSQL